MDCIWILEHYTVFNKEVKSSVCVLRWNTMQNMLENKIREQPVYFI